PRVDGSHCVPVVFPRLGAVVPLLGPRRAAGFAQRRSRGRSPRDLSRGARSSRRNSSLAEHAGRNKVQRRLGADDRDARMTDGSLPSTVSSFARGWEAFFHAPCDGRVLAAIRIVYCFLVLIHLAVLYPDLDRWYGETGVLPIENARKIGSPFAWSLFWVL